MNSNKTIITQKNIDNKIIDILTNNNWNKKKGTDIIIQILPSVHFQTTDSNSSNTMHINDLDDFFNQNIKVFNYQII